MQLKNMKFKVETSESLKTHWYGSNWPVVYIIHNHREAYIGETTSVRNRIKQHLDNPERKKLQEIKIIADRRFNKSSTLDIESKLIEHMSSDGKFVIQNSNSGMRNHDYYQKDDYNIIFEKIWKELLKHEIVQHDLRVLRNSDLFKYTPYKNLTEEQYEVVYNLMESIAKSMLLEEKASFLINGEAGTGKTVLAMYIMKILADKNMIDFIAQGDEEIKEQYGSLASKIDKLKFALVVPMTSLRSTLKSVAKNIKGLKSMMVIGPSDVLKDDYDIIIVDEAHRLRRRTNITNYRTFDQNNRKLGLDKEYGTELDWIMLSSKYQILFYDSSQSIRPTDVRQDRFEEIINSNNTYHYHIRSQLRSKGGEDYIDYIKSVFSNKPPTSKLYFEDYEFKIVSNISDLKNIINKKNKEVGLSRLIAGYAWEWKSKGKELEEIEQKDLYDIKIDNEKFIWNRKPQAWITSSVQENEVGSIHTTQGYDLNYAGIIIGPELTYDFDEDRLKVIPDKYQDANGKRSIKSEQELEEYILNIYSVLLSRAIHGTYIYACDSNLRTYLQQFIEVL